MKLFLIRQLFNLIEKTNPKSVFKIDKEKMREWLDEMYIRKEFRDYIQKRDMELLQQLGKGVDRESYLLLVGQRLEIAKLLSSSKQEFEKAELKAKKKVG